MEKIILNFSIKKKQIKAEEYIDFCKKIIINLQSFDEVFKPVNVLDVENRISYFFKNDLSDFTSEKLKLIINEEKDIVYNNPNPDIKELTKESTSWMGFSSLLFFGNENDIESIPEVSLNISQGATGNIPASMKIEYSNKNQYKLSKEYIFRLIEKISNCVELYSANAISHHFFLKVRRKGQYSIGWINYTTNKSILEFLVKEETRKELEQGVIFSIAEKDLFDKNNQSLINRSFEISDFLGRKI